jgi:hypothetical protein
MPVGADDQGKYRLQDVLQPFEAHISIHGRTQWRRRRRGTFLIQTEKARVTDGQHTVNERSSIAGHHQIVRWVHAIIQNTDAYTGQE